MTPVKDPNVELVIVMFIIPLFVNVSKICFYPAIITFAVQLKCTNYFFLLYIYRLVYTKIS